MIDRRELLQGLATTAIVPVVLKTVVEEYTGGTFFYCPTIPPNFTASPELNLVNVRKLIDTVEKALEEVQLEKIGFYDDH